MHSIPVKAEVVWREQFIQKDQAVERLYFQWRCETLICYLTKVSRAISVSPHTSTVLNLQMVVLSQWNTPLLEQVSFEAGET